MYRDDTCAVCGESLPPDHFYCREHGAQVDDRLHAIGELLPRVLDDVAELAGLLDGVAQETWDYLAERAAEDGDDGGDGDGGGDEPEWPPVPDLHLRADADDVEVDVDTEPGFVRVHLRRPLQELLAALAVAADVPELRRLADACAAAEGADGTH